MSTKVPVTEPIQPEDVTMNVVSVRNRPATINSVSGDHA
jgi:hypothetical protein